MVLAAGVAVPEEVLPAEARVGRAPQLMWAEEPAGVKGRVRSTPQLMCLSETGVGGGVGRLPVVAAAATASAGCPVISGAE